MEQRDHLDAPALTALAVSQLTLMLKSSP